MTASDEGSREAHGPAAEYFDVLIIGAGISGIDAAYRINEQNPHLRYAMLERRDRLGGTWDLFRYPGVRSDSDIFTLSFPFEPWSHEHAIAGGEQIWQYLVDTADKHHIAEHIRVNTHVRSADWDSATDTWTVRADQDGPDQTYRCRFLYCATGYYDYDHPYTPDFRGIEDFSGRVVHPQHWPESLDYAGKRVVVIGSGATAVTIIPVTAEKAAHAPRLPRSPTYVVARPTNDQLATALRPYLPTRTAYAIARWYYV